MFNIHTDNIIKLQLNKFNFFKNCFVCLKLKNYLKKNNIGYIKIGISIAIVSFIFF